MNGLVQETLTHCFKELTMVPDPNKGNAQRAIGDIAPKLAQRTDVRERAELSKRIEALPPAPL